MDGDNDAIKALSVLEEEPDVNDWVEILWGCFLIAIGLHDRMIETGN